MVEAVRTTASPAAIWTICVVVVACLIFWLAAIAWADMHPIVRHRRLPRMPGPVLGGMHLAAGGRSVAPNRDASAMLAGVGAGDTGTGGSGAGTEAGAELSQPGAASWRVPGQRPGEPRRAEPAAAGGVPVPPAQRSGEADRPERSVTGPGAASTPGGAAGGDAGR